MFYFAGSTPSIQDAWYCGFATVGFPIRKSPGKVVSHLTEAYRRLTTSFIASKSQGIHHTLLVPTRKYRNHVMCSIPLPNTSRHISSPGHVTHVLSCWGSKSLNSLLIPSLWLGEETQDGLDCQRSWASVCIIFSPPRFFPLRKETRKQKTAPWRIRYTQMNRLSPPS